MKKKYDEKKFNEVTDVIIDIGDYELNGDLVNLMEYFKQIIKENKKKYHRIYVRATNCKFIIYGDRLDLF